MIKIYRSLSKESICYSEGCINNHLEAKQIMCAIEPFIGGVVVANTCHLVGGNSSASTLYILDGLKAMYPSKKFFIIGCNASMSPNLFRKYGVVIDNQQKFFSPAYGLPNEISIEDTPFIRNSGLVVIQRGCNNNCAFCNIPKLRGRSVSVPYQRIYKDIRETTALTSNITLVGTATTQYKSGGMRLPDLCKKILVDFPDITLTVASAEPDSDIFLDLISFILEHDRMEKRIENVGAQSFCNKTLRAMNNALRTNQMEKIYHLTKDKMVFRTDVIVGFPGETEEDFNETLAFAKKYPLNLNVLVFHPLMGSAAVDLPMQISEEVKRARAEELKKYSKPFSFHADSFPPEEEDLLGEFQIMGDDLGTFYNDSRLWKSLMDELDSNGIPVAFLPSKTYKPKRQSFLYSYRRYVKSSICERHSTKDKAECGHSIDWRSFYADSYKCMLCDVEE